MERADVPGPVNDFARRLKGRLTERRTALTSAVMGGLDTDQYHTHVGAANAIHRILMDVDDLLKDFGEEEEI